MHRKVLFLCLKFGVDMAKQTVNVGNNANDGSGDAARTAFTKMNQNNSELYNQLGADGNGNLPSALPVSKGGTGTTDANSVYDNIPMLARGVSTSGTMAGIMDDVKKRSGIYRFNIADIFGFYYGHVIGGCHSDTSSGVAIASIGGKPTGYLLSSGGTIGQDAQKSLIRTDANTTVDGNGYLKPSSPVVRLFADKVELINESVDKPISFEKLGVGDYLVKNTTGLRDDGWFIETPRDSNGNVLVFVEYTQLDNKDISVKTYKKKFDIDTASIVADHDNPMDIPTDRWIDLRFNDYPVTEQQPTPEATS